MHPFGQIVVVLSVPVPFQSLIAGLLRSALVELLADSEPPGSRVLSARLLIKTADPPGPRIVRPVPPQYMMDLIDQSQLPPAFRLGLPVKCHQVTDRKSIRPKIPSRRSLTACKSGGIGKFYLNLEQIGSLKLETGHPNRRAAIIVAKNFRQLLFKSVRVAEYEIYLRVDDLTKNAWKTPNAARRRNRMLKLNIAD